MSLDRKDVRLKLTPAAHSALQALADYEQKDISELGSLYLERTILGEVHVAKLNAERAARWGRPGGASGELAESERRPQGRSGKAFRSV
jgi:hypothetical protein